MPKKEDVLELVEETATLEKRDRITGRVRVSTRTETAEQLVSAALEQQDVDVTRVPVDREVDIAPPIRTENGVTIVPVLEEILVVEKRLVLREEIHIRQTTTTQSVEVPVELRRQHAVVERDDVTEPSNKEDH
jgi:stress response protein YsnF